MSAVNKAEAIIDKIEDAKKQMDDGLREMKKIRGYFKSEQDFERFLEHHGLRRPK